MAQQVMNRWKPDQNRSTLEALVMGESGDGSTGTAVLVAQAFTYDDTELTNINQYVPGDPATEKFINVVYEGPVQLDIPTLAAMTNTARRDALDAALDAWGTANYGLIQAMAKISRTARRRNPRPLIAPA